MGAPFVLLPTFGGEALMIPPQLRWGGAPVIGGGGVMSSGTVASDPSVRDYADTSPTSLGRNMMTFEGLVAGPEAF